MKMLATIQKEMISKNLVDFHGLTDIRRIPFMASIFRAAGRLYGRAVSSKPVSAAMKATGKYIITEMKIADIHLRVTFLKRKFRAHQTILGRTAYRLVRNGIDPMTHRQVQTIIRVLGEIENELAAAEDEVRRRREEERAKYDSDSRRTS